ncbi:PAS-domain containing protein [Amaricoccus macauensis]|uniref:PAS-domain containing protein n=1 Tax=Amaricoccus macauensis TaxID=57001 RepID=UPI003C7E5B4F
MSAPARALLEDLGSSRSKLVLLKHYLLNDCPSIQQDLDALVVDGIAFRHHCPRGDGSAIEILGEPRGSSAVLSIRPASEEARALQHAEDKLKTATREIGFLRAIINSAPVLAWIQTPDNQITWANTPYRERFNPATEGLPDHRIANAFGHVMETVPLTARGSETRARKLVAPPADSEPQWFEVQEIAGPNGSKLGYAIETNELVAAEASLRRFVETLTETFAHLPIGLAVFDKNRRLGLFNPALTELVKIDAVWLAGRPSLRDFLERLRETRQMPDQKDFAGWRRKLSELEEGARHGTYQENWVLPSGKVFRVTGRPHPQGALAFLFEDISANITLERKYRSELELSQATLDKLNEAVAVFNASGSLVFVNSAFEALWQIDPMESLEGPTISDLSKLWAERCAASPVWAQLAEFATAEEARTTWSNTVEALDGRSLQILVAPLPDASALVVFRDLTAIDYADSLHFDPGKDVLTEFALEQIRVPAETAVKQVLSAIPENAEEHILKDLNAALQVLKDGINRSEEFRELARNSKRVGKTALPALAAALEERGLHLDAPEKAKNWNARMRSTAMALGLAVADQANAGSAIRISLETGEQEDVLVVLARAANPQLHKESQSVAIARRIVSAGGGEIEVTCTSDTLVLNASLPRNLSTGNAQRALPDGRAASA